MSTQQEQKQGAVVVAVVKPAADQEPGTQDQMQIPPDPVYEQVHAYSPPANPIALDPIIIAG